MHPTVPRGVNQAEREVEPIGPASINVIRVREETGRGEGLGVDAVEAPAVPLDEAV